LAATYSRRGYTTTTIGNAAFDGRVRNGIEHDRKIFGCAVLYPYAEERMGEMACLTVSAVAQGMGDGERLLKHIEQRAREAGLTKLFVLTTRTAHWFLKRGFVHSTIEHLPAAKQAAIDRTRNSQVYIKQL